MTMEKLLQSKRKLEQINQGPDGSLIPKDNKKRAKRAKFDQRYQRVTTYLLNSVFDDLMELRDQGYKQTDLMNEAVRDLVQKYNCK